MTREDVISWVERIKAMADDDEAAHGEEDDLHVAVLEAIKGGRCDDPQMLAIEALKTRDIKFARWCA